MKLEIEEFVKHHAVVESLYPAFVEEFCKSCSELYTPGSDDEQHFIDVSLNISPFLRMPTLYTVLFVVEHPIVIPEHLMDDREHPGGWKWGQVLYGIARATIEADIRQKLGVRREILSCAG